MGWARLTIRNVRRACLSRDILRIEQEIGRIREIGGNGANAQALEKLTRRLDELRSAQASLSVNANDAWVRYLRAHEKGTDG